MKIKWSSRFELKAGTWVYVPTSECSINGQIIKAAIEGVWQPPKNYFHLRTGGHVASLKIHLSSSVFAHLDIKNFFGSISKTRVTRVLIPYFGYAQSRKWANQSTVTETVQDNKRSILPFGFVQSPAIASLCLAKSALGSILRKLRSRGVIVSVYMDDIVLSSNDKVMLESAISDIKHAAKVSGFMLNADKEEGPAASVSAFNILLSNTGITLDTKRWTEFSEQIKVGSSEQKLRGIIGYVRTVDRSQAEGLEESLKLLSS